MSCKHINVRICIDGAWWCQASGCNQRFILKPSPANEGCGCRCHNFLFMYGCCLAGVPKDFKRCEHCKPKSDTGKCEKCGYEKDNDHECPPKAWIDAKKRENEILVMTNGDFWSGVKQYIKAGLAEELAKDATCRPHGEPEGKFCSACNLPFIYNCNFCNRCPNCCNGACKKEPPAEGGAREYIERKEAHYQTENPTIPLSTCQINAIIDYLDKYLPPNL